MIVRKRTLRALVLLGLLGASVCPALTGCSHTGTDTSMTPQEEKNFKGGPMPEAARQAMAAQGSQAKSAQAPGAAPSKP